MMKHLILLISLYVAGISNILAQKPPNIILIMADDLGYEALSMYGNDHNQSPNLERMASEGILFENCYSTPLCTPSRVQIMTGKYNFRNYIGFGLLDPAETTFGHILQNGGYKTCVAGKWQLYGYERQWELAGGRKGTFPEDAGFDQYCLWQITEVGSRFKNPRIQTKESGLKTYVGQYGPDVFVEYIEEFMENNAQGPFFIYYPMVLTHDPFEPTPALSEFEDYDPDQKVSDPKYFPAMVEYMDMIIGRIVQKTEDLGIDEETLIIFVGDNGTSKRVVSHVEGVDIQGDKGNTTNYGTHVPMVAYWPGHIQPGIHSGLVDFTDFVPTLMELSGQKSEAAGMQLDGVSFLPFLTGKGSRKDQREWVFCHYDPNWGNRAKRRFVHDVTWKLYDNGDLFKISVDPFEKNVLSLSELNRKDQKIVRKFQAILNDMK